MDSERQYAVVSTLADYVKSPSLRHLRDPHSLQKVAREVVKAVDRASSVWGKWDGPREEVARAAAPCWIPIDDLQAFLNGLPGPALTRTDVAQRLRAFYEEPYVRYPNEDIKDGCLALYEAEKAQGTEMRAIIGALEEFIDLEEERLRCEREERFRRERQEEKDRLTQRFMAGADCGWIQIGKADEFYCRRNGRAYRVVRAKDKRWELFRIAAVNDQGSLLGTYSGRREASKVLEKLAYEVEPRW